MNESGIDISNSAQERQEYQYEASKFDKPLYKPWWKSGFPTNKQQFFTHRYSLVGHIAIQTISLVIWFAIAYNLYRYLDTKERHGAYIIMFTLLLLIPIVTILVNIYVRMNEGEFVPHVAPEYPVCMTPNDKLSHKEKEANILASIGGDCVTKQYDYLSQSTDVILTKGYNLLYILFTLVLLFFSVSGYSKFFDVNDLFLRTSIRTAALLSVILFTVAILGYFYWYSLYALLFYSNIVQMNVTVIIILTLHFLFLVIRKGMKSSPIS